jgi:hypothetical protein
MSSKFLKAQLELENIGIDFIKQFIKLCNVKPSKYDEKYLMYKSVNTVIICNSPRVLLFYYLTIFKLTNVFDMNYGNGSFCKLFIRVYRKMPKTVISLFYELPNYHFFAELIKYIDTNFDKSTSQKKLMYHLCMLFVRRLKKDKYNTDIALESNTIPIISNACYFAPWCSKASKYISYQLFKSEKLNKEYRNIKYDTLIDNLTDTLQILLNDDDYHVDNYLDLADVEYFCFNKFKKNYSIEYNNNIADYTLNDINKVLYDTDFVYDKKLCDKVIDLMKMKMKADDIDTSKDTKKDKDQKKVKFSISVPISVPVSK